jgi:maleate isomerase
MSQQDLIRVGVLVPQGNVVHAAEFERLKPDDVEFSFLGFGYPPQTAEDFCADLTGNMMEPVKALRDWGAQVILVGCTTASMACAGSRLIPDLEAAADVPVVTAASAAREAIAALDVQALGVATPYGDRNNQIIVDFLSHSGVQVAAIAGLDLDRSVEAWVAGAPTLTPERVFELSRTVAVDDAEGLYLPCTGMGSLDTIGRYEAEVGKPAFSSVQAGYWAALRRIGYDGRREGMGRLLQTWDF